MKIAWLTDIHLNFLDEAKRKQFYQELVESNGDQVFITGDIAEADSIEYLLVEMAASIARPIYFVLGNHDYYRGQIADVKNNMIHLSNENQHLNYLPNMGVVSLGKDILLVGQDGWADGRLGDYFNSNVRLADSRMIADLFQEKIISKDHLLKKMQQLANNDAARLKIDLIQACENTPNKVIVLTHVPPFKECSLYENKISNDDFIPFFSSKVIGDVLLEVAVSYPCINFLVLAGHTHHEAEYQALDNLWVKVGRAEYYEPRVQYINL